MEKQHLASLPHWDEPCSQCGQPSRRTFLVGPMLCSECVAKNKRAEEAASYSQVECTVDDWENDEGNRQHGVEVTCSKCGHATHSYGSEIKSIKRCLYLMHDTCPEGESNFYTCEELRSENTCLMNADDFSEIHY